MHMSPMSYTAYSIKSVPAPFRMKRISKLLVVTTDHFIESTEKYHGPVSSMINHTAKSSKCKLNFVVPITLPTSTAQVLLYYHCVDDIVRPSFRKLLKAKYTVLLGDKQCSVNTCVNTFMCMTTEAEIFCIFTYMHAGTGAFQFFFFFFFFEF